MALTEQQKAQNKAANAAKRRAHSARCRLLRAAIEAAEAAPDVLAAKAEADAAHQASEVVLAERERRMQELRVQIKVIERQIEEARNERSALDARDAEKVAWSRYSALKEVRVRAAESAFPDLAGDARWSVAVWEPPREVQAAMNAARAAVGAA